MLRAESAAQEMSSKSDVQFIPGGATQNSMRMAQWLLQVPGAVSYFGCVGKDKYAKIMEDTAKREGLNVSTLLRILLRSFHPPACLQLRHLCHADYLPGG